MVSQARECLQTPLCDSDKRARQQFDRSKLRSLPRRCIAAGNLAPASNCNALQHLHFMLSPHSANSVAGPTQDIDTDASFRAPTALVTPSAAAITVRFGGHLDVRRLISTRQFKSTEYFAARLWRLVSQTLTERSLLAPVAALNVEKLPRLSRFRFAKGTCARRHLRAVQPAA